MIRLPQLGVPLNLGAMKALPWHEATVNPAAMEPTVDPAVVKAPWARACAEARVQSSVASVV